MKTDSKKHTIHYKSILFTMAAALNKMAAAPNTMAAALTTMAAAPDTMVLSTYAS